MSPNPKQKVVLCRISPNFRDYKYKAKPVSLAIALHSLRSYCLDNSRIRDSYDIEIKTYHLKTETEKIIAGVLGTFTFINRRKKSV